MILAVLAGVAGATTLEDLLAKGPVSVVETKDDGRLKRVTVYAKVDAPVDAVWAKLIAFEAYSGWMPGVESSEVLSRTDSAVRVAWSIKVPGPNFKFTADYALDAATRTVSATGTAGGLTGGQWQWHLSPSGAGTLIERTTQASAVIDNWIVSQFDDDQHSMELGLNTATPLLEVRGLAGSFAR